MKNPDKWKPGKFVFRKGRLRASRDTDVVRVGSRLVADRIAEFFGAAIPEYVHGRLVDLGCGEVPLYEAYKDYVSENICADWADSQHRNEFLDVECDLNAVLPFEDDGFDTIILSDVLEHLPEPEKLWSEMYRILDAGGIALISVPFYYPVHEAPHDYYRYTEFALRRFAERSGFDVVMLEPLGGTPEILADILSKHYQFIPLIGKVMAMLTQGVTGWFVRTSPGRSLSLKTAKAFPLGYFVVVKKKSPAGLVHQDEESHSSR